MRHIAAAWSPWFDDAGGLIKVLLPRSNTLAGSFKGTADAAYQYFDVLQAHRPDAVAVFAADHIYRMDVRQMAAFHRENAADATIAAVSVPIAQASSFGIMSTDSDGRVREFKEKPRQPTAIPGNPLRAYASMGNYLFRPELLGAALRDARSRGDTDFGRDVLPRLCAEARVYAYDFARNVVPGLQEYEERAYWRDVGTLSALAAANRMRWATVPALISGTGAGRFGASTTRRCSRSCATGGGPHPKRRQWPMPSSGRLAHGK